MALYPRRQNYSEYFAFSAIHLGSYLYETLKQSFALKLFAFRFVI
jgi:hypothetical protein